MTAFLHPPPPPTRARTLGRAIVRVIAEQRDRWILWLPAGAIAGAAIWLSLPDNPPRFLGLAGFVLAAGAAWAIAAWPAAQRVAWVEALRMAGAGLMALCAAGALGAAAAEWRTDRVAAPRLPGEIGPVIVEGWVEAVEIGAPRTRMKLRVHRIEGLDDAPVFVRITSPGERAFTAGRAIRCRAMLRPPDGPLAPGGYDFARRAYFEQLGATGFALGSCRPIEAPLPEDAWTRAVLQVAALRSDMAETIHDASPGRGGAVAASLIVGDRSHVAEEVNQALFDSGLGHILSVSGLHMSIAGGVVYAGLAALLSLVPALALRFPVPKLAAGGALVMLTLYLIISGASVPAQRAFVMAAVALGAKLIDRPAISMRGLALAALLIVLWMPESVLEPGFQMSFAATAALVAAFEGWDARRKSAVRLPTPGPIVGSLQAISAGVGGALMVSFVAGLATDPFALYHFQRYSVYGLPANLAVSPLVTFVMAPAAVLAALAAPFGLQEWPLRVLAAACDLMVGIGEAFSQRPEALRAMPKPPDGAFLVAVVAIVWGCFWRGALRWIAVGLFAGALAIYAFAPRPALYFDGELRTVLSRDSEGDWRLLSVYGRSTFARDRVGAMAGLPAPEMERLPPPEGCAEAICVWSLPRGARVAVVLDPEGFADSALDGALVLSRHSAPAGVRERAGVLLDAPELETAGGGAITVARDGSIIVRRAQGLSARPWT